MKILKINVEGLPLFAEPLEIDLYASQRVPKDKNEMLTNIFSNNKIDIYTNNVLSVIGINASGKTTTLKVLSFAMQLLQNKAISAMRCNDILDGLAENQEVCLEIVFYDMKQSLCKLQTYITKQTKSSDATNAFVITKEFLYAKSIATLPKKSALFAFSEKDLLEERNLEHLYLLDDVSIMVGYNKKQKQSLTLFDLTAWTDFNAVRITGDFQLELVKYLDPSIERLEVIPNAPEHRMELRLKFENKDEIFLNDPAELNKYLSSGTIKGINVFITAMLALQEGGYLIIDELENHFNMEIVMTLIGFFTDHTTNKAGATLIFSTHYIELIDNFARNDCIYVARNTTGIKAEKLNHILTRNDVKRSEWFRSGYFKYTTPSYQRYIEFKRKLVDFVQDVEV